MRNPLLCRATWPKSGREARERFLRSHSLEVRASGASPSQQTLRASRRAAGVSRAIFGRSVATAAPRGRLRLKLALVVSAALGDEVAIVLEEEVGQLLTTAFGHLGDLLEVLFARRTR